MTGILGYTRSLRRFLGHADVWDGRRYHYRTLVDNVGHLNPELLVRVSQLIVEGGHAVAGKKAWRALARAL